MFTLSSKAKDNFLREVANPEKKDNPFVLEGVLLYLRYDEFRLEFDPRHPASSQTSLWQKLRRPKEPSFTVTIRFYYLHKEVFNSVITWNGKDPLVFTGLEGRQRV
jgi:hypothetical protein